MTLHRVLILGAGAAGTAAARTLTGRDDIDVTLIGRSGEKPYTRMLIKGVATGPTPPEVIQLPLPPVRYFDISATSVDTEARHVTLESGGTLPYDSLIVATGSTPRMLPSTVIGAADARAAGKLTALHSMNDALRIRRTLQNIPNARVLVYGAGATAAEAASLLAGEGHEVTLIARSTQPGASAFGSEIAEHVANLHRARIATSFGTGIASLSHDANVVTAHLDDGTSKTGDLLIVALGTTPLAPAPWEGGVAVNERLHANAENVWAAGGVSVHDDDLGTWRIDHWEDSAAQGTHAAQEILFQTGLGTDPGPYRPRSPFMAMIHGHMLSGVGFTATQSARIEPGDEVVFIHEHSDGTPVGASGLDAVLAVHQWKDRLHTAVLDSQP